MTPRIAILGIGAMGSLFGAKLSPHADVTLMGHWVEQIDYLNHLPIQVKYPSGEMLEVYVKATNHIETVEPVDFALILTKSSKTRLAAQDAVKVLKPDGLAITLQNGLDNYPVLLSFVGEARATLGVTAHGATLEHAGLVRYGGSGDTHLATRADIDTKVRQLAEIFEQADIRTEVLNDINGIIWGKLAVNAAINPLSAILRMPNGSLVASDWARDVMHEAAREVEALAHAQDIALPFSDAAARAEQVARLTAKNFSSMLQDVMRGTQTEIENISGAIVRRGELYGVPTPMNMMLYRLVKALDEMAGIQQ